MGTLPLDALPAHAQTASMAAGGSTKAVVAALLGNLTIAAVKYFAAYVSGSSSMLAEGHHSLAEVRKAV